MINQYDEKQLREMMREEFINATVIMLKCQGQHMEANDIREAAQSYLKKWRENSGT